MEPERPEEKMGSRWRGQRERAAVQADPNPSPSVWAGGEGLRQATKTFNKIFTSVGRNNDDRMTNSS